jgi:ATP-dependent RNA helicase DeaD
MSFPATHPSLEHALAGRGFAEPTAVQSAVLEPGTMGRDLLVSAQTGSGKTVAYGLALSRTLLGEALTFAEADLPLALVVAPTRELAVQVHLELSWLYAETGARIASCIGGMDPRREARALEAGCHIVVGTPGRLRDHMERRRLDLSALRAVVLDEADEMLNLGFREDMEFILDATPPERRTLLFSATIPPDIAALAKRYQRESLRIDTIDRSQPHGDIEYRALRVLPNEVEHAVVNVLRFYEARATLIFCQTREAVRHLHASLIERGFAAVALSGELTQAERTRALQSLRDGSARACVATDVAARGIDLPGLELVIHAELPTDRDTLLHRSGRTGRAGRKGICILLVPINRRRKADALIAQARIDVAWSSAPTAEEIRQADQKRLISDAIFQAAPAEEDQEMADLLSREFTPAQIAAALVRLYRARLPSAEEVIDWGAEGDRPRRAKRDRERPDKRERETRRTQSPDRTARPGHAGGPMVWFRMNVGRSNNADPKWILPVVCRVGQVTRSDIGSIKIGERETTFEVSEAVAQQFAAAVRRGAAGENVHIQPAAGTVQELRRSARGGNAKGRRPDGPPGPAHRKKGGGKPR